jgi:murein DD-endopeptidase MepM/ murein hydrolase activator NlpD
MPVNDVRFTSGFGMRTNPVEGGRRAHKGVDLAGPTGTPIHAAADGVVGRADWFGGYGLYVALEHGGNMETRYGHMSRLNVAAGQRVHKGDVIGYIGSTGHSTGPHLHYEVRIAGEAVNPIPYLQAASFQKAFASADTKGAQGGPE